MKTQIGIGHIIRAMQLSGFGHEEIMAMREAMVTGNFNEIAFCKDVFTSDWEDESRIVTIK